MFSYVPAAIAVVAILLSFYSLARSRSIVQALLAIVTISLSAFALMVLVRMLVYRAWPTFLPHILLAVAAPLALLQAHLARHR